MPDQIQERPTITDDDAAYLRRVSDQPGPEARPPAARRRAGHAATQGLEAIESAVYRWLLAHSITSLRVSLGAVFLLFGLLKFFPGISPAADLVMATTSLLTFDLIPGSVAIVAVAVLECVIGLWLLSGRALRGVIYLLAIELVGIISPVVLLSQRLFSGPHHAPTLEGQYVLKDAIIVSAVFVLAATVRGARLTDPEHGAHPPDP
jgi:putative oxidoreductase